MTTEGRRERNRLPTPGQAIFFFMCGFCLILILRSPDTAIEYMGNGLILCVKTVIPALFPFMIVSELIVSSGFGELIGKYLDRPVKWIFGISGASASAVLLGAFCGFPIGARTAVSLLDHGCISKSEATRLLTFCNNPSSAFIISAVGVSLYSNRKIGVILYLVTLINALIIGVVQRFFVDKPPTNNNHKLKTYPNGISAFTSSVTHSAEGMLTICAYVVFFSTLIGCLSNILNATNCSPLNIALIYGGLELSGGVSAASALETNISGICLCAFIIGWSGLSVHFQIISVCAGRGLRFKWYFIAKLIQGLMNSLVMYVVCLFSPHLLMPPAQSAAGPLHTHTIAYPNIIAMVILVFVASLSAVFRKGGS